MCLKFTTVLLSAKMGILRTTFVTETVEELLRSWRGAGEELERSWRGGAGEELECREREAVERGRDRERMVVALDILHCI